MRCLTGLAESAVTILTLAAGSSSSTPSGTHRARRLTPGSSHRERRQAPPPQSQGDAVTGTITWPDGNPAANTQIYWFVGGPYRSDPSVVQSEIQLLNPSLNGGDYSPTGGSWQDAESRTSGG